MEAFRFLHAADLHLDSPFRGMAELPPVIRERVKQSTFQALTNLVEIALAEQVDFLVIAGDVYDLADRSLKAQIRFQQAMNKLADAGISVYIVHGNHDPMDGKRARLNWPAGVHFYSSEQVEVQRAVRADGKPLADIYGISYAQAAVTANLAVRFAKPAGALYSIGLLHANVDGDTGHDNYAPCTMRDLVEAGMNYWALGHIHTRSILNVDPPIVYPGNIQGRNIKETGPKGVYVVDVSEFGETKLKFHAVDSLRWFQEELNIGGLQTEQELKDSLESKLAQIRQDAEERPCIVRLKLVGSTTLHSKVMKSAFQLELLTELREMQVRMAEEDDSPFVWIESFKVRTTFPLDPLKLAEEHHFIADLMQIAGQLSEDRAALKQFREQALRQMLAGTKTSKVLELMTEDDWQEWLLEARDLAVNALIAEEAGWEQ